MIWVKSTLGEKSTRLESTEVSRPKSTRLDLSQSTGHTNFYTDFYLDFCNMNFLFIMKLIN